VKDRRHWYICAFLFGATVLNYMDRQTLGTAAPLIQKDFSLDNAQLGALFSAFYIAYGVTVAGIGEVIDRVSIRIAFAAVVTWWSVATGLTALASGFRQLFGLRMLLGVGEAGNWPATARLVSMYMPPQQRTLANSIYMGGGSLGLVLVQPLLVWLASVYGWRVGFVIIAALSTVWIVAWLIWFRDDRVAGMARYDQERTTTPMAWREILVVPRFWGLMCASLFGNTCLYFLMNWIPTFLVQDRHFAYTIKLGGVMIVPFLGLDSGYLLSGLLVLRLSRWIPVLRARRTVLIGAAAVMAASVVTTPFAKSDLMLLLLLFGTTLGMAAWNANYLCAVEELSPQKVSAVAGIVGSVGAFGGAISLWLVGVISQAAHSFTPVFLLIGLMICLGSAGILLTGEPRRLAASATASVA
jgi:MFS transporter, ACS family, hexuronate transporter